MTKTSDVVYIRSRRTAMGKEGHPCLKCHPNGWVQSNTYGEAKQWEEWKIHFLGQDSDGREVIALQAWTGQYLTAHDCGRVGADWGSIGHREKWQLIPSSDGFVAFRSCHLGKHLVCDDLFNCGNQVRADREHIQEWEEWAIVSDPWALADGRDPAETIIAGALIGVGAAAAIGALAIPLLGFGVGGVRAGSLAATTQSIIYGGATGGAFSVAQSIGARQSWAAGALVGGAVAATGAAMLQNGNVHERCQNARYSLEEE